MGGTLQVAPFASVLKIHTFTFCGSHRIAKTSPTTFCITRTVAQVLLWRKVKMPAITLLWQILLIMCWLPLWQRWPHSVLLPRCSEVMCIYNTISVLVSCRFISQHGAGCVLTPQTPWRGTGCDTSTGHTPVKSRIFSPWRSTELFTTRF